MRILFDHGTPQGLAKALAAHDVTLARTMGWQELNNGKLLQAAEDADFNLLLTTDQRIRYQQNLSGRKIALLVLKGTTKWSRIGLNSDRILASVNESKPSDYIEVFIPYNLDIF